MTEEELNRKAEELGLEGITSLQNWKAQGANRWFRVTYDEKHIVELRYSFESSTMSAVGTSSYLNYAIVKALDIWERMVQEIAGTEQKQPTSFGRFVYFKACNGYRHLWSTTDPPIYGARIGIDRDHRWFTSCGETHPAPTQLEVDTALAMVRKKG